MSACKPGLPVLKGLLPGFEKLHTICRSLLNVTGCQRLEIPQLAMIQLIDNLSDVWLIGAIEAQHCPSDFRRALESNIGNGSHGQADQLCMPEIRRTKQLGQHGVA